MRIIVALVLLLISTAASAQVAVVNIGVRDAVDRDHLRNMLLGRVTTWADGTQVVLVLANDEATRVAVFDLTGRDLDRLLRGWKRILFSGNGAMPLSTTGANEALALVAQRPGAIAIVGVTPPADPRIRVAMTLGAPAEP